MSITKLMDDLFRPNKNMIDEADDDVDADLDAEIDDSGIDGGTDDLGGEDDLGGDMGGEDMGDDSAISTGEFGDDEGGEEIAPEPEAPVPEVVEPITDDQKVSEMFTDTGNKAFDYGVGTEANIRLATFKFSKADINPNDYMDEVEILTGLPSNAVEDRLSPEQKQAYLTSNREIRKKYPAIGEREKNILIYNSNVPMLRYDLNNNEEPLVGQDETDAYARVDEYLTKRFGIYWQDKRDAVKVLKEIKVNFSDKNSIQPNLVAADDFTPYGDEVETLPFDKVFVDMPDYIDEFIRSNLDNPEFIKSSIFSALSSPYKTGMGKSNSVYAIIKGEVAEEPMEAKEPDPEEDMDLEAEEEDAVDEIDELEI